MIDRRAKPDRPACLRWRGSGDVAQRTRPAADERTLREMRFMPLASACSDSPRSRRAADTPRRSTSPSSASCYPCDSRTTSVEQWARCATRSLTEPSALSPCRPRLPTTTRSASAAAETSACTGSSGRSSYSWSTIVATSSLSTPSPPGRRPPSARQRSAPRAVVQRRTRPRNRASRRRRRRSGAGSRRRRLARRARGTAPCGRAPSPSSRGECL
jgi:hypothetical protein